jgi:hypothetical protein
MTAGETTGQSGCAVPGASAFLDKKFSLSLYPNQWLLSAKVVCKRIPSSVGSKPNQFQLIDWIIFTGVVIETFRQQ